MATNQTGSYVYGTDVLDKKANNAAVNALYQAYFRRPANQAELNNWGSGSGGDTTVRALEDFLKKEKVVWKDTTPVRTIAQVREATSAAPDGTTQADTEDDGYVSSLLESKQIDEWQAEIMKYVLKNSGDTSSGQKIYTDAEIEKLASDAELLAKKDLDPYYDKVTGETVEDLRTQYADLRNNTLRYQQQEAKTYAETLADTKQSIRARGLTFSGASRRTLGAEGALNSAGVEGELPQSRRYNWEDKLSGIQESARNIGKTAERTLGSAELDSANIDDTFVNPYKNGIKYDSTSEQSLYKPSELGTSGYVGVGDLSLERKRAIEAAKQEKLAKQKIYI